MRSMIIVCIILLSGELVSQAQLNYDGNPRTDNWELQAQESRRSRTNTRPDYRNFEVDESRTSSSKVVFTPSAIDPFLTKNTNRSISDKDKNVEYKKQAITNPREKSSVDNDSSLIESNQIVPVDKASTIMPELTTKTSSKPLLKDSPETSLVSKRLTESSGKKLPVVEKLDQPSRTAMPRSMSLQEAIPVYRQTGSSQVHKPEEQSSSTVDLTPHSTNLMNPDSHRALRQFLNSRTPEESQIALDSYLSSQRTASSSSGDRSTTINDGRTREHFYQRENVRDTFDNEITMNPENHNPATRIDHPQSLPVVAAPNSMEQIPYSMQNQYPSARWNQMGIQSRRDHFPAGPPMRRPPFYRGSVKSRMNPWLQSRLSPGPPIYHQKESLFGPSSGLPTPGINGHWKQPVEVIYTKPPGFVGSGPTLMNPALSEDAGKWFPDSEHRPPQKDVYYSQLYSQSYDPHYYNYIAKTGKIKPWLYGKLGKKEEKSIWWELYSGFKNHGMKNMMNPMFLLGMSIPTLTLMLSALVQKRSMGRSNTDDINDSRELIEKYEPQIRASLLAYENQLNEKPVDDPEKKSKVQKRSVEWRPEESREKFLQENGKSVKKGIGPAPPGIFPFEEFFLNNLDTFAVAFKNEEKKLTKGIELRKNEQSQTMEPTST